MSQGSVAAGGTLTVEPWGVAGARGMAFIDEGLVRVLRGEMSPLPVSTPQRLRGFTHMCSFQLKKFACGGGQLRNPSAIFVKEQSFGVLELDRPEAYVFQ